MRVIKITESQEVENLYGSAGAEARVELRCEAILGNRDGSWRNEIH